MELIVVTKKTQKRTQYCKQMKIIDLFGNIDFDSDYDYKAQRNFDGSRSCHPREGGEPESIKTMDPRLRGDDKQFERYTGTTRFSGMTNSVEIIVTEKREATIRPVSKKIDDIFGKLHKP